MNRALHPSITVEKNPTRRWLTLWKGELAVGGYPSSTFTRKRDARQFAEFVTELFGNRLDNDRVSVRTDEVTALREEIERLRASELLS